jgi:hypothetical protein
MMYRILFLTLVLILLSGCSEMLNPDSGHIGTNTEAGWNSDNPQGKEVYEVRDVQEAEVQWTLEGR